MVVTRLNQATIDAYMDGFRKSDRRQVLACLTDDVEWILPGLFHAHGKDEFASHIVDEGFESHPDITVTRSFANADVVVSEGRVRARRTDGGVMNLVFCDVFEMRDGKIARLTSYLMQTGSQAPAGTHT